METMDTSDEIPLEDHRYFRARLDHLETQNPAALLNHLENGTLTQHLRQVTGRGMQAKAELMLSRNIPEDQADEMVMNQIVADPSESSSLRDSMSWLKLQMQLAEYKAALSELPRTYLSQSETTE